MRTMAVHGLHMCQHASCHHFADLCLAAHFTVASGIHARIAKLSALGSIRETTRSTVEAVLYNTSAWP